MRYNDRSVLENHHSCRAFQVLNSSGLLSPLPRDDRARLRSLVVNAILYTDMSLHKELLARVAERSAAVSAAAQEPRDEGRGCDIGGAAAAPCSPADASLLVAFLLHCADLCNPLLCVAYLFASSFACAFATLLAFEFCSPSTPPTPTLRTAARPPRRSASPPAWATSSARRCGAQAHGATGALPTLAEQVSAGGDRAPPGPAGVGAARAHAGGDGQVGAGIPRLRGESIGLV